VLFVLAALLLTVLRSIDLALATALFLAIVFAPLVDTLAERARPDRPAPPRCKAFSPRQE
jgi:predicted PurR-regulated permease PerM